MQYTIKNISILLVIAIIAACSTDKETIIREKIVKKKKQVIMLNKQIAELEAQIADSSYKITPVSVKEIIKEEFNHYIEVTGNIEAEKQAYISPEINGQIKKIYVDEGQQVKKGQLLISLKTDVTESAIKEVKTGLELAAKVYEKQKELWEQKIGSEIQYLQAKNAKESAEARLNTLKAQLAMANIKAPFDGIVDRINSKTGELAAPGMPLLQLVNLKNIIIKAEVSEVYLPSVKKGKLIEVNVPTYPDLKISVPVYRTGNVINPANRTFTVEVRLPNKGNMLKPNMMAVLKINDMTIDKAIVIPSNIIKKDIIKTKEGNFREFVFIAEQTDSLILAKKVYVETGNTYNNQSVILKGLQFGQQVIVEGYNTVSTGTAVKILNVINK